MHITGYHPDAIAHRNSRNGRSGCHRLLITTPYQIGGYQTPDRVVYENNGRLSHQLQASLYRMEARLPPLGKKYRLIRQIPGYQITSGFQISTWQNDYDIHVWNR
jgi:hypothetical protein